MKLTKSNVCVFIENEAQLQEARELLERYGEKVNEDSDLWTIDLDSKTNHIYFHENYGSHGSWCTYDGGCHDYETPITPAELEQILQNERPIH